MHTYRVNTAHEKLFELAVSKWNLTSSCSKISPGAPDDYNKYVSKDVLVFAVIGSVVDLNALRDDLKLSNPTKATFESLGGNEYYL